jgi:hypothetical protein
MRRVLCPALALAMLAPSVAGAQVRTSGLYPPWSLVPNYDRETEVWRERIRVMLLPTYLGMPRPDPPVRGFYAWKMTFDGATPVTLVLRPDSAMAATDDRAVLRASRLYRCQDADQPVLECDVPVRATTRRAREHIELTIEDGALATTLRAGKPTMLYRQLFEPGGRFRVDEAGVIVR